MQIQKLISLFFLFLSLSLFAQQKDTLNQKDSSGLKQGYWKNYKEKDSLTYLAEEGRYFNNLKNGMWVEYYIDGKIKNKIEFKRGKADGNCVTFYKNGNIHELGTWKINKWVGDYVQYYESTNTPQQKFTFDETGKRIKGQYFTPDGKEPKGKQNNSPPPPSPTLNKNFQDIKISPEEIQKRN